MKKIYVKILSAAIITFLLALTGINAQMESIKYNGMIEEQYGGGFAKPSVIMEETAPAEKFDDDRELTYERRNPFEYYSNLLKNSNDPMIRQMAIRMLGRIAATSGGKLKQAVINLFITHLVDESSKDNRYLIGSIIDRIGNAREKEMTTQINVLLDYDLEEDGIDGIYDAIAILGLRGDWRAVGALNWAMTCSTSEHEQTIRANCAEALGNIGGIEAVRALTGALNSENSAYVRIAMIKALGKIGDPSSVQALIYVLKMHNESGVRIAAAEALGKIGGEEAVTALIWALGSSDSGVMEAAALALGAIGDPSAIDALSAELLGNEHTNVRIACATALGMIGHRNALPALRRALNDEDQGVREAARKAIRMILGIIKPDLAE